MAPNPTRVRGLLEERVWSKIPALATCSGQCWESCGPVESSVIEHELTARAGVRVPHQQEMLRSGCEWCPALTADRRCAVYDVRPTICRLWGAVETLPCVYGCVPEGGRLSHEDGFVLLWEAMDIGGWPAGWPPVDRERFVEAMRSPQVQRGLAQMAQGKVPPELVMARIARGRDPRTGQPVRE